MSIDVITVPVTRGTSNTNARGSTEDRRRRREWLVETYRADHDARVDVLPDDTLLVMRTDLVSTYSEFATSRRNVPACRCYRCGTLLTVETVTVDRIIPGCRGGTYRRNNIRPACGRCNSETGGALRSRT